MLPMILRNGERERRESLKLLVRGSFATLKVEPAGDSFENLYPTHTHKCRFYTLFVFCRLTRSCSLAKIIYNEKSAGRHLSGAKKSRGNLLEKLQFRACAIIQFNFVFFSFLIAKKNR